MERLSEIADNHSTRGKRPNNQGVYCLSVYLRHQQGNINKNKCIYFRLPNWLINKAGWKVGDRVEVLYEPMTQGASIVRVARGGRKLVASSGDSCVFQIKYCPCPQMPPIESLYGTKMVEITDDGIVFNF